MSLQSVISNHDDGDHDGHNHDGDQDDGNKGQQTVLDRKHHLFMMINQLLSCIYYQFITQQMDISFIRCMRVYYRRDVLIHNELSHIMTLLLSDIFQSTNTTTAITTATTATKIQFILIPVVYITKHYDNDDVVDIDHDDDHEGDDNNELSTVLAVTTTAYDIHMIETEKWIYSNNR